MMMAIRFSMSQTLDGISEMEWQRKKDETMMMEQIENRNPTFTKTKQKNEFHDFQI